MNETTKNLEGNLSYIRHELRSPLNAIIGYTEMLIEQAEDEGQKDFLQDLQRIRSAGHKLLKLITNMLQPGQLKQIKEVSSKATFDLEELVSELAIMFQGVHNPRSLKYILDCETRVFGQEDELFQATFNLLDRFADHTTTGDIDLKVSGQADGWYSFEISGNETSPAAESALSEDLGLPSQASDQPEEGPASLRVQVEAIGGTLQPVNYLDNRLSVVFLVELSEEMSSDISTPDPPHVTKNEDPYEGRVLEFGGILMPETLLTNLKKAAEEHNVTDLRKHLDELRHLDQDKQRLAAHLTDLANQYNMDAILNVLGDIRHE
jgi:hypothetical protein